MHLFKYTLYQTDSQLINYQELILFLSKYKNQKRLSLLRFNI